jgi:hypothetical protein
MPYSFPGPRCIFQKSIGEQTLAKRRLNATILTAMSDIAPTERLILDVAMVLPLASFATLRAIGVG